MKSKAIFVIYIFTALLLLGCKTNKEKTSFKQKDKAPDSLKELSKSFDEIFETLDKIEKVDLGLTLDITESKNEKDNKSQDQSNNSQKDTNDSQSDSPSKDEEASKESQASRSEEAKTEMTKDEKLKIAWKRMDDTLDQAHSKWNDFQVEGIKKGITREKSEKFQTSFNKMTKSVEDRNIVDIYDFGSQSLLSLKAFYDLYLDEIGGDISELKYIGYQAYLRAISDDILGALILFQDVEENVNRIRLKIGEKEEKIKDLAKVNNSLLDMRESLVEESKRLFMIKKEIIMKNLKELE